MVFLDYCLLRVFIFDWICVQSKIQSLAGQHSDVLESLSPVVRKRVEVLREIQVYSLNFEVECVLFYA